MGSIKTPFQAFQDIDQTYFLFANGLLSAGACEMIISDNWKVIDYWLKSLDKAAKGEITIFKREILGNRKTIL